MRHTYGRYVLGDPVEHILTACLQVRMECVDQVTALLYDGYVCLVLFQDTLKARALHMYYSMTPSLLTQSSELYRVYGSAVMRILGPREYWLPYLSTIPDL